MQNREQPNLFDLEPAIDRRPLTVAPAVQLPSAIAMMGKAQSSCIIPTLNLPLDTALISQARANSLLVLEGDRLLGVLTTQDALRAIAAAGDDLASLTVADIMSQSPVVLDLFHQSNLFDALLLLRQHQIRHLPVVDASGRLLGQVTPQSLHRTLKLEELLKTKPVTEVITVPLVTAPVTTSAQTLAQLMVDYQTTCILIAPASEADPTPPVGIVTEQDILLLRGLSLNLSQIEAQQIMRTPLLSLKPSESVLAAQWQMHQQYVQHAIVADDSGPLGIVTLTSYLQALDLSQMRSLITRLQQSVEEFATTSTPSPVRHSSIAGQAQSPETNTELREELERNRLLTSLALRIRESLNLDEILKTAVTEVRQFLQTDRVLIYRFHPNFSGTVVVESVGEEWSPALASTITDTCFGTTYAEAYKQGRIQVTEDIYTAGLTQCHLDILTLFDVRANLVVPILQGEHLWGLLCAYHCSRPRRWRQLEIDLLKQLSTQIAIAIQQSELYHQLQTELAVRRQAEEQIKASLKEKEVLLKEIHHRVKNNLQIISSLLKLQSSYIRDQHVLEMFRDSQSRIRSMALIHEKLYQSKNLSRIRFAEYAQDLINHLHRSYSPSSQRINLQVHDRNIWLSIDTAVPCGLIVNELVSNALKHAFSTIETGGRIEVDLVGGSDRQFTLMVRDNGIGFPENLDFRNTESLGLELVCTLTEQLRGTIELEHGSGTTFRIRFAELDAGETG